MYSDDQNLFTFDHRANNLILKNRVSRFYLWSKLLKNLIQSFFLFSGIDVIKFVSEYQVCLRIVKYFIFKKKKPWTEFIFFFLSNIYIYIIIGLQLSFELRNKS